MFLLVGLISGSGSVGASLSECSTSRGKFTSGEFSKNWGGSRRIQILLIPDHPTVARIKMAPLPGMVP